MQSHAQPPLVWCALWLASLGMLHAAMQCSDNCEAGCDARGAGKCNDENCDDGYALSADYVCEPVRQPTTGSPACTTSQRCVCAEAWLTRHVCFPLNAVSEWGSHVRLRCWHRADTRWHQLRTGESARRCLALPHSSGACHVQHHA